MSLDERHQDAVLWPILGRNDQGEDVVGPAIPLKVRWEDKRGQTVNAKGGLIYTDAMIWLDRVVDEGSILWRGELNRFQDTGAQRLYRVEYCEDIGDLEDNEHEITAHAVKYMGKLPQIKG